MSQWIPGARFPPRITRYAQSALDQFNKVLDSKPDLDSQKNRHRFHCVHLFPTRSNSIKPSSGTAKPLRSIPTRKTPTTLSGVIAWTQFITPDREARTKSGMKVEEQAPIKDKEAQGRAQSQVGSHS